MLEIADHHSSQRPLVKLYAWYEFVVHVDNPTFLLDSLKVFERGEMGAAIIKLLLYGLIEVPK